LKFLLDRILPKERSVRVDLPPIDHASDAVDAVGAIIEAVATGQIAPNEGSALATLVATYAGTINDAKVELRLDDIEKRQKEIQDALENLKIR
jgi:outer membrane lipoprotein SlyB